MYECLEGMRIMHVLKSPLLTTFATMGLLNMYNFGVGFAQVRTLRQ